MSMRARGIALFLLLAACGSRHVATDPGVGGHGASAGADAGADAGGSAGSASADWPGGSEVTTVDGVEQFAGNLSGITYEPAAAASPAVLWGVSNIPGKLYRLVREGATSFVSDMGSGWPAGKLLHYPGGAGEADAEGVTFGESSAEGLYVVAEHDNDDIATSRLSVLRYDPASPEPTLSASHEWDVTAALPPLNANLGLEAITWIPDDDLLEQGFFDAALGRAYDPDDYPSHAGGLFVVGVEQSGELYGFALNHDDGSFTLLASLVAPHRGVMGLEYDRDQRYLWAYCDDACGNQASVFIIDQSPGSETLGQLTLHARFLRPAGLPDTNHEGMALAPDSECEGGSKPVIWADDNDTSGHSLRQGSLRCGEL